MRKRFEDKFGVELAVSQGFVLSEHPEATFSKFKEEYLQSKNSFELACLEVAVATVKSFSTGVLCVEGDISPDEALDAAYAKVQN